MSKKVIVNQKYKHGRRGNKQTVKLPKHKYSKDELLALSHSPASLRRPSFLEDIFNGEDGKWDPEFWYRTKFETSAQSSSPAVTTDKKPQRKLLSQGKELRKKSLVPERLKEKDGIVLSPQRRSFDSGCHVQTPPPPSYSRHLTMPDREEARGDLSWDKDRERSLRKMDGQRFRLEKNSSLNNHTMNHNRINQLDRKFECSSEKDRGPDRGGNKENDRGLGESGHLDCNRRERRLTFNDRSFHGRDKTVKDRDWRQRELQDRSFDINGHKRSSAKYGGKEPEWFTGGPSSRTETIELGGFEKEYPSDSTQRQERQEMIGNKKAKWSSSQEKLLESLRMSSGVLAPEGQRAASDSSAVPVTLGGHPNTPATSAHTAANLFSDKGVDAENVHGAFSPKPAHGQLFTSTPQFFPAAGLAQNQKIAPELMFKSSALDTTCCPPMVQLPTYTVGPMGAMQAAHPLQYTQGQDKKLPALLQAHLLSSVPNSAGDNNALMTKPSLPPSVKALFGGGDFSPIPWKPVLNGSLETPECSLLEMSGSPSQQSFSSQDAETELKAFLFHGGKGSISSGDGASMLTVPAAILQHRAKTLSELEADMRQNIVMKAGGLASLADLAGGLTNMEDAAAVNRLLIMISAASEANQHEVQTELLQSNQSDYGTIPSHSEFNNAVMRNKERQFQLLQQSLKSSRQQDLPLPPLPHTFSLLSPIMTPTRQLFPPLSSQSASFTMDHLSQRTQQAALQDPSQFPDLTRLPNAAPGLPLAMSTPQPHAAFRLKAGGFLRPNEPVVNLMQQNMPGAEPLLNSGQQNTLLSQHLVPSSTSPVLLGHQNQAPQTGLLSQAPACLPTPGAAGLAPMQITSKVQPILETRHPPQVSSEEMSLPSQVTTQLHHQGQSEQPLLDQVNRLESSSPVINIEKPLPAAQHVLPPVPQPKGVSLDMFTPTSVLRHMNLTKCQEKQEQALEQNQQDDKDSHPEPVPDRSSGEVPSQKSKLADLSEVNFLDSVNPQLVPAGSDSEAQPREADVLTGPLSHPMSVEEKMKLSALAEMPGHLSHMLDKSAKKAARDPSQLGQSGTRAICKGKEVFLTDQSNHAVVMTHGPPSSRSFHPSPGGRPVTGASPVAHLSAGGSRGGYHIGPSSAAQISPSTGRAIVGCSSQQGPQTGNSLAGQLETERPPCPIHPNVQNLQSMLPRSAAPPVSVLLLAKPVTSSVTAAPCAGSQPVGPVLDVTKGKQQALGVAASTSQHISHLLAMQLTQQPPGTSPLHAMMASMTDRLCPLHRHELTVPTAGPLSSAALSATIQMIASPHCAPKLGGRLLPSAGSAFGSRSRTDLQTGIGNWFGTDILQTQLPNLPPLPTFSNQAVTVDELERH